MRGEASLRQNAFVPGHALARADGSLVLPGATSVVEHTDRGLTHAISEAAVAATTPAFALDPAFGGAARPPTISVRLAPGRLTNPIAVSARTSGPGLCLLRVTAARPRRRTLHGGGLRRRPPAAPSAADRRPAGAPCAVPTGCPSRSPPPSATSGEPRPGPGPRQDAGTASRTTTRPPGLSRPFHEGAVASPRCIRSPICRPSSWACCRASPSPSRSRAWATR